MQKRSIHLCVSFSIIAGALTSACGNETNSIGSLPTDSNVPVIRLQQKFGEDGLGQMNRQPFAMVQTDDSLNVYVQRQGLGRGELISFSKDGEVRWRLDSNGEGPGDIRTPAGFAIKDDTLYLANQVASRIDRFMLDGQYINSTFASTFGASLASIAGFLSTGELVTWRSLSGEYGLSVILVDTDDWTRVDSFVVLQTGDREIDPGIGVAPMISTVGNYIVVSHIDEYKYSFYTAKGVEERYIARPDVYLEEPTIWKGGIGPSIISPTEMYPLFGSLDGVQIGGGTWPLERLSPSDRRKATEAGKSLAKVNNIDIFSSDGTLMHSLSAEPFGIKKLVAADAAGNIYAELSDEIGIGRFSVEID